MNRRRHRGAHDGAPFDITRTVPRPCSPERESRATTASGGGTGADDAALVDAHLRDIIARQLAHLMAMLRPWGLADRVADADQELADGTAAARAGNRLAQHIRLARVLLDVARVVKLDESPSCAADADALRCILEIYAAAIACSSLVVGCDELIVLAESKVALWCAGVWASPPHAVRWC